MKYEIILVQQFRLYFTKVPFTLPRKVFLEILYGVPHIGFGIPLVT